MDFDILLPILAAWAIAGGLFLLCPRRVSLVTLAAVGFTVSGILTLAYLAADYFTGDGITDAVLYHVLYGFDGAGFAEYQDLLFGSGLALVVLLVISVSLICRARRLCMPYDPTSLKERILRTTLNTSAHGLLFWSIVAHPTVNDTLDLLAQYDGTPDLSGHHADLSEELRPIQYQRTSGRPKNIVYLYAESLEHTYFDERRFPGLIKELRQLEAQALSFTNIRQAQLTDWTIAGMTASQCGIPLSTFGGSRNGMGKQEKFLPGTTCMGDILSREGYYLSYMGGADLQFAGKGKFYQQHSFRDVEGSVEFKAKYGQDIPVSKWGIHDDLLFEAAYEKFIQLAQQEQPFGLFLLTLDTHSPMGYETPACGQIHYGDGANQMLNSVACADHLIAAFIQKLRTSPYAANTIFVLGSDHLAMRNGATEILEHNGGVDRINTLMFFDSGIPPGNVKKPGTTLDIGPTVLSLLGFQTDSYALGRNLLGPEPTLVESLGLDRLNSSISKWRLGLWKYWADGTSTRVTLDY